jgi:hypothetical protein
MRAAPQAWIGSLAALALSFVRPDAVRADEALHLMREPTAYTDVIDAADDHDRFDVNVSVGYRREVDHGTIRREYTSAEGERQRAKLADSQRIVSQLFLDADIGLYKDVMAFVRVPLILSDTRELSLAQGVSAAEASALLAEPGGGSAFAVPLLSPVRAGFDYMGFGAAAAVTSQERKAWLPTWIFSLEGRRALGPVQRPCHEDADKTLCRGPSGAELIPSEASKKGTSAVSRGVSAVLLETRVSKRYRYAEPYGGLGVLVEWASTAKHAFQQGGGFKETAPGRQFTATLGAELIPWEHRGRHQRVSVDARGSATYVTAGLDYSALYDALGSHDEVGPRPGLTTLGARMKVGGRLGVQVRAARYVRFALGAGMSSVSAHPLTNATPCESGASCPRYRPSLDAPGRRFWMTQQLLWELYASATAQF